jgi:integrase
VPPILLTDIYISLLKPKDKQFEICDTKVKGLTTRISRNAKTFNFHYRIMGRSCRLNIGRFPSMSLKEARQKALEAMRQVSNGIDPQTAKLQARSSYGASLFSNVASEFIDHAKRNTRTWKETDRIIRNEFVRRWGRLQLQQISKLTINPALGEIESISGPSAANHAFAMIRRFFNWCVQQGHLDYSPCQGMKPPSRTAGRSRVLADPELAAILLATDQMGFPFGPHVKLLISTAQRRSEVSALRWNDLDIKERTWTQPANMNKSRRSHIIPLSNLALETIRPMPRVHDDLVFPARGKNNPVSGYSKWKCKLDSLSGVSDWTLHDLRRTAATGMARLKVPLHIIELVLNHRSKSLSGVAGIYNRHEYLDEQRNALDRWASHVENLVLKAQNSAEEAATTPQNFEAVSSSSQAIAGSSLIEAS